MEGWGEEHQGALGFVRALEGPAQGTADPLPPLPGSPKPQALLQSASATGDDLRQ